MDIRKLIKANIRYKKGSFKSIIILMFIISLSITTIVSLKKNFPDSISSAYDRYDVGDVTLNVRSDFVTDEAFAFLMVLKVTHSSLIVSSLSTT